MTYWHTKKYGPYIGYIRKSKLGVNQPQFLAGKSEKKNPKQKNICCINGLYWVCLAYI
jgi:hypothetical protein